MKIIILVSHPIQYHSPLFSFLASQSNISLNVFYTGKVADSFQVDRDFGIETKWNIELYEGYQYAFINQISSNEAQGRSSRIQISNIIEEINTQNPSILIIFGWKRYAHMRVMRYFKGKIPIVFRGDSTSIDDYDKSVISKFVRYTLLSWVYKYVDYVLSPGSASDLYFKKSGLSDSQIIRAKHAVNNSYFSTFSIQDESILGSLRTRLAIKENEVVFVFAGKFIIKKNPLFLIDAFAELSNELNNLRLVLVGDGILKTEIQKKVNGLNPSIANRIDIMSFQDQSQMKVIYRLADVFILPSKGPEETWGLSVNEALASGIPVLVSSKCGCAYDLVVEGVNGYTFESDNKTDLITKMKILSNYPHRKILASQTIQSIQDFSFNSFKKALDHIFDTVEI
jgi:glycosyltransferase involved in cell wall biosynthesis